MIEKSDVVLLVVVVDVVVVYTKQQQVELKTESSTTDFRLKTKDLLQVVKIQFSSSRHLAWI